MAREVVDGRTGHILWGKEETGENVYEAALDRIRNAYALFDTIIVSFSGGKDSTAVLNLTIQVAEELGRLPVKAIHVDEEAIPYETEDYVRRVAADPRVDLDWWCTVIEQRNACSDDAPHWYNWAPEDRDLWCREMPPEAITDPVGVPLAPGERVNVAGACSAHLAARAAELGQVGLLLGIRADESLTRRRAVSSAKAENYIVPGGAPNIQKCQPPGTMVAVVDAPGAGARAAQWSWTPIERVRAGDLVVSYRMDRSNFVQNGREVYGVVKRDFSGDLVRVDAGGYTSRYTPEHRCLVGRFGRSFTGHHVYLMRRGHHYRIGRCAAWNRVGSGMATRAKTEGADAMWILGRFDTAQEAAQREAYLQWAYGIPGVTFRACNASVFMDQQGLDRFWTSVGDLTDAAKAALEAHGRDIHCPIWKRGQSYFSRHRGAEIHACNLMDGMEVITAQKGWGAPPTRAVATVTRERYEGPVYSLGVAIDETYVADGLVTHNCYPIYDWVTADVWTAPALFGWDYNAAYDLMEMAGVPHSAQRCAPPYAEQPLRGLYIFKLVAPTLWDRMCRRVPGASTGARYGNTALYSFGALPEAPPEGLTWPEFIAQRLGEQPEEIRPQIARTIQRYIRHHFTRTTDPIVGTAPHPRTGQSWQFLYMVADRGDLKLRTWPDYGGAPGTDRRRKAEEAYERVRSTEDPRIWEMP